MSQSTLFDEKARRMTNKEKILAELRRGPRTNRRLAEVGGYRYSARIKELRDDGYNIETGDNVGGLVVYTLKESA